MATAGQLATDAAARLIPMAGEDARLESEVLLAHAWGIDRTHVLARLGEVVPQDVAGRFNGLVDRRLRREPLAYIVGHREFYGIEITCAPGALIPRPETEMLVDFALEELERRGEDLRIVDVGTGAGAIAVAIAVTAMGARVLAADVSADALEVARRNVERHHVGDRVELRQTSLLDGLGTYDVILANLPYVSAHDFASLVPEIRVYEPASALIGGTNGTEVIEELLRQAPAHLAAGGVLAAEIGETQGAKLTSVARSFFPTADAYVMKDFAGRERVLIVRSKGGGIG